MIGNCYILIIIDTKMCALCYGTKLIIADIVNFII